MHENSKQCHSIFQVYKIRYDEMKTQNSELPAFDPLRNKYS